MKCFKTFLIVLIVVAALVCLKFLPQLTINGYDLRQVDILAEIMADTTGVDTIEEDVKAPEYIAYKDSVPKGMIPIEDFKDSLGMNREMDRFYEALNHVKDRPVRIAYFGDSFIEGDILTAYVREFLQKKYGGRGVGFIDIQSQIAGFKTTVTELSKGWVEYSYAEAGKGFNKKLQGISSRYYIPTYPSIIDVRCQNNVFPQRLDTVQTATIYFTPGSGLDMEYSINDKETQPLIIEPDSMDDASKETIQTCTVSGKIGRIKVKIMGQGRFYGIALDGTHGIQLDNFAMRSTIGWQLSTIPMETLKQFAKLRGYDLIIMQYGLNIASPTTKTYTPYCIEFKKGIKHLRKAFPNASLLLLSMSNRDERTPSGDFKTMRGVTDLVKAQRQMAKDEHIAFWNLQKGMGGSGSMAKMQKAGEAGRDYTHINFKGGKTIGKIFFKVLMNGKMNYDKRKELEFGD